MLLKHPDRFIGKKVYSADGHEIGTVAGIAHPATKDSKMSVWLQTGGNADTGRYVSLDELTYRKGRLTLKDHYDAWSGGIPMHR